MMTATRNKSPSMPGSPQPLAAVQGEPIQVQIREFPARLIGGLFFGSRLRSGTRRVEFIRPVVGRINPTLQSTKKAGVKHSRRPGGCLGTA